jgi:predicted ATP-dependent endonuclease of OLD family
MHLQRVQVPDFRVLKDVDITFEKDFNPRVFPLGSQNGGGKSTLLQLIFVLLHCSTNSDRLFALKNLLNGFYLRKDENKRVIAIIDVWDGEKVVQMEFFLCAENHINQMLNDFSNGSNNLNDNKTSLEDIDNDNKDLYFHSFYWFATLEDEQQKISRFSNEEEDLKNIIEQFSYRHSDTTPSGKFPDNLKNRLLNLGIKFDSIGVEFSDPNSLGKIEKETKKQLLDRHNKIRIEAKRTYEYVRKLTESLKLSNIKYISSDIYQIGKSEPDIQAVLCRITNLGTEDIEQFLESLSNKVFLAAPSTQIFLFLSRESRKSLFINRNIYSSELISINSKLSGLFTYDFLAVDTLIAAFKNARDIDFREALKTGEYGDSYKKLLKNLDFLMHNKQVNLRNDFSGLTFKINRFDDNVELYPEDLSHGELKRLSIYIWLKHNNIEDAIVLMDEIDIALHPEWQYQIVSDLIEWVPSNQYILATHSYELCNALTPSHVKVLEPKLTERHSD